LHPEIEQLIKLEREMNGMVGWNETEEEEKEEKENKRRGRRESDEEVKLEDEEDEMKKQRKKSNRSGGPIKGKIINKNWLVFEFENGKIDAFRDSDDEKNSTMKRRRRRREEKEAKSGEKIAKTEEEMEETIRNKTESAADAKPKKPVEVDVSDETR
jgi:hypothetical protein